MFIDDIVKECNGSSHTIGWNGQLWLPAVLKHCKHWGFTIYGYEKKKLENLKLTQEVLES